MKITLYIHWLSLIENLFYRRSRTTIPQVIQLNLLENKNAVSKWEAHWHQGIICVVCWVCMTSSATKLFFMSQSGLAVWIFFFLPIWAQAEKGSHAHSGSLFYVKSSIAYLHTFNFVCMKKNQNINTTLTVIIYVNILIYFSIIPWICIYVNVYSISPKL